MVQLQLDRKRPEAALAYVERSKARSLLEVLQTGNSGITKAMTPEERDQEGILSQNLTRLDEQILRESQRPNPDRKRITEWSVELEKARTGYRSFETVLYAAHPQLEGASASPSTRRESAIWSPPCPTPTRRFWITPSVTPASISSR